MLWSMNALFSGVKDNGAGMRHEDIPDMLGRVLSGTKFGVRQTRGKFGLGAKMALIWSKVGLGQCLGVCTDYWQTSSCIMQFHRKFGRLNASHHAA